MITRIIIECDRCHEVIKGWRDDYDTIAGYYNVSSGYWRQFANDNENNICDSCMFSEPRYIEIYGHVDV